MTTRTRWALAFPTAALSLSLALAPSAFAQDKKDDAMKKDTMSKDTMSKDGMKKDTMSKDTMSKDSMKDGMKKDDGMMKKGN
jgi:pentapeptide MXKDX repeat protein